MGLRPFFYIFFVFTLSLTACRVKDEAPVRRETIVPSQPPTQTYPIASQTPSLDISGKQFKLTVPDSKTLIQLRMYPYQMPQSFATAFELKQITLPEPNPNDSMQMIHHRLIMNGHNFLIENDFRRYFPQELPGASVYLFRHYEEYNSWPSHYLFGRGVIDFLNTYGHSLDVTKEQEFKIITDLYWYKGKIALQSVPMQLDNDFDTELLLLMHNTDTTVSDRYSAGAYIPVNITPQNHLQIIPNDFGSVFVLGCGRFDTTHDLNHDRQDDILLFCEYYRRGFSISQQIVFGWNEKGVFRIGGTGSELWTGEQMPYEVEVDDVDLDGFEEIVWRTPCEDGSEVQCAVVKTFSWDITDVNTQPTITPVNFSACEQLEDTFKIKEVNGIRLVDSNIEKCFSHLKDAVLANSAPNIPDQIFNLLDFFPANNPDAQPYFEHLTYLLGYYYELSSEEETAVSAYLDLIQHYPNSPWSWLAWARLEPIKQ